MPEEFETINHCDSCGSPMDVSDVPPFSNVVCPSCQAQTRVKREFGPYTLIRRHAIGGMSMVFTAYDNTLDREVALKILSEEYSADERRIAAFEEEARITASFTNPNVVRVLKTGRAFGRFYIAMEYVPGGHFEHQIRHRGKIPEVELLPFAIEVAQGLKAAHAAGLIHRDVKPGNILLDAEGHAKLVDFGLALVTQGGKAQAKELWATPYYVPPESVEGHVEDFRSDIYALGATLYHALSGKPSCDESSMSTDLLRAAKKKIVPLALVTTDVSPETCRIVDRAMAYNPDDRYGSYDELISNMGAALAALKSGRSATPTSAASRRRAKKKRMKLMTAGAVVAGVLVVGGALVFWMKGRSRKQGDEHVVNEQSPSQSSMQEMARIGQSYRQARSSMVAKDYPAAAQRFRDLFADAAVQEPTRTWVGLESVIALYLDSRNFDAFNQSKEVLAHMTSGKSGSNASTEGVVKVLGRLGSFAPVSLEPIPGGGASQVVTGMLAGLKNWEQGMLDQAVPCFQLVRSAKLSGQDEWAAVYQKIAADYLEDHATLSGPLFAKVPSDKAACQAAIDGVERLAVNLRTNGRSRFNVRSWQSYLKARLQLLNEGNKGNPTGGGGKPVEGPKWPEVWARIDGYSSEYRFEEAVSYLKSLPGDPKDATRTSLQTVVEFALKFFTMIELDISQQPAVADMQLKSGELIGRISIDTRGRITAITPDGRNKSCKWADFSSDSLISLHRVLIKIPRSEDERLRRNECAVAFDWLAGNRTRALAAAANLSQGSADYKNRWSPIFSTLTR